LEIIEKDLNPKLVNLIGVTEIMPYSKGMRDTLENALDNKKFDGSFLRLASIGGKDKSGYGTTSLDDRDEQILKAIKHLMGKERTYGHE